jgi:hypothetical protein
MTNYSFCIPRMSADCGEDYVRAVFADMDIGCVRRVDFVAIDDRFQTAFVHMESMFDTGVANYIKIHVFGKGSSSRIIPDANNQKIYWILLKNVCPIQDTKLNIHQVVENHRILEQLVFRQQEIIDQQSRKIDELMMWFEGRCEA